MGNGLGKVGLGGFVGWSGGEGMEGEVWREVVWKSG